MTDITKLKETLEKEGEIRVTDEIFNGKTGLSRMNIFEKKVKNQPKKIEESLLNIIKDGNSQFEQATGRPMTYSEMREMYG